MYAQCEIDAGLNRNICPSETLEGAILHGEVISGDVEEFIWETVYYDAALDVSYYASQMLSDTSILQPIINQHYERTVKYYLKGITADNTICVDSVELNFSDWTALLIDKMDMKAPEDTVELWIASESNWPNIKYEWSPNYMISDTTVQNPKVWNDTTVFYSLSITDSLGCSNLDDIFEVFVNPTSTINVEPSNLKVYPIPAVDIINIESEAKLDYVRLYDINGNLIKHRKENQLDISELNVGMYILQIRTEAGELISKKVYKSDITN